MSPANRRSLISNRLERESGWKAVTLFGRTRSHVFTTFTTSRRRLDSGRLRFPFLQNSPERHDVMRISVHNGLRRPSRYARGDAPPASDQWLRGEGSRRITELECADARRRPRLCRRRHRRAPGRRETRRYSSRRQSGEGASRRSMLLGTTARRRGADSHRASRRGARRDQTLAGPAARQPRQALADDLCGGAPSAVIIAAGRLAPQRS